MGKDLIEIKNAIYTGICIYKTLSRKIVTIEGEIVSLEDKKDLSLYLGIIHSENNISNILLETNLKKDTYIKYKKLDENEVFNIYNKIFNNTLTQIAFERVEDYFTSLLNKHIIIKLNREYNFNPMSIINNENKQLIKK